jgi:transposase
MQKASPMEFRQDVIRVYRDSDATMAQVAKDFGISPSYLKRCLAIDERNSSRTSGPSRPGAESDALRRRTSASSCSGRRTRSSAGLGASVGRTRSASWVERALIGVGGSITLRCDARCPPSPAVCVATPSAAPGGDGAGSDETLAGSDGQGITGRLPRYGASWSFEPDQGVKQQVTAGLANRLVAA